MQTLARSVLLFLGSIAVMVPWPVLGILVMRSSFDKPNEAFLLFGGITAFPLMILALFGPISEDVLIVLFLIVWLAAALVPILWFRRRLSTKSNVGGLLMAQSAFSFAQAAMGTLLIIGKNI